MTMIRANNPNLYVKGSKVSGLKGKGRKKKALPSRGKKGYKP